MLETYRNPLSVTHENGRGDESSSATWTRPVPSPSSIRGLSLGSLNVSLDIFLYLIPFLDIPAILALRSVCKELADATRSHSVWAIVAKEHIINKGLPWPLWAVPLAHATARTLEQLSIRAIRLEKWWDNPSIPRTDFEPSPCIIRPSNSINWMKICCSRWLMVQLNGARMEFWDLQNLSDRRPARVLDGIEGHIDGAKLLVESPDHHILTLSTRSNQAHALRLSLPPLGVFHRGADISHVKKWDGYSELLDATEMLWAFARTRVAQRVTVVHSLSGRAVTLGDPGVDPLLLIARAIEITPERVAVATSSTLDIYDMAAILAALSHFESGTSRALIPPSYSLRYPSDWIGSGLKFLPVRPTWMQPSNPPQDSIHLILTNDRPGMSIGLVASKKDVVHENAIEYVFKDPYCLFLEENTWTIAMSWGESARRMVHLVNTPDDIFLTALSISPDSDHPQNRRPKIARPISECVIPDGGDDYAYQLAFDESAGVTAVAMASGRIWIMDPCGPADKGSGWSFPDMDSPLHPDPVWSQTHSIPWFNAAEAADAELSSEFDEGRDDDFEFDPPEVWTSSVDEYFPGKNDEASFGGATWFANETLHLQGNAKAILFTEPRYFPFPAAELVQLGDRFLLIRRHDDSGKYEAWLLESGATAHQLETLLHAGGSLSHLLEGRLAVEESIAHRYQVWRSRMEPIDLFHM